MFQQLWPADGWSNRTQFTTPTGMEGWLTKHKRFKQSWRVIEKSPEPLEGNYKKRYFYFESGILFYFDSPKAREAAKKMDIPISKAAKGSIPLHSVELIEDESKSERKHTFVLDLTNRSNSSGMVTADSILTPRARGECLLVCAENDSEKKRWIATIKGWQSQNLASIQAIELVLSDDDDDCDLDEGVSEYFTDDGTPYYFDHATQQTSWEKPTPRKAKKYRQLSSLAFSHSVFLVWVKVIRAKLGRDQDRLASPYVKVVYKDMQFKTGHPPKSSEMDWSDVAENFEFHVEEKDLQEGGAQFAIELRDNTMVGGSTLIGVGNIAASSFWEGFGKPFEQVAMMFLKDEHRGEVVLELRLGLAVGPQQTSDSVTSVVSPESLVQNQFGVPLLSLVNDPSRLRNGVPRIVWEACDVLRRKGLTEPGIFRVSGVKSNIYRLRVYANLNWNYDLDSEDVNNVSGLLKLYLRELPEPLIPSALYTDVLQAVGGRDSEEVKVMKVKQLIRSSLPPIHFKSLVVLTSLLKEISDNATINMMHPKNLAVVIGPNIIRSQDQEDEYALSKMPLVQEATELIIKYFQEIFEN